MTNPEKIIRCFPIQFFILVVVMIVVFSPLFTGRNFLPFSKHPELASGLLESGGQKIQWKEGYRKIWLDGNQYLFDIEPAWFTLNLSQDIYFAKRMRAKSIPLWDPYTGCGVPTFESGQFRPFNPFKVLFYLFPGFWSYSLFLFLQLLAGAAAFFFWSLDRWKCPWGALSGALLFALNPWILSRIATTDGAGYLVFPWVLLALERTRVLDLRSCLVVSLALAWMGHVSHPEAFLLFSAVAFLDFFMKNRNYLKRTFFILSSTMIVSFCLAVLWVPLIVYYLGAFSYKSAGYIFLYPYSLKAVFSAPSDMFIAPVLFFLLLGIIRHFRENLFWLASTALSLILMVKLPLAGNSISHFIEKHAGFQVFYLKPLFWFAAACLLVAAISRIEDILGDKRLLVGSLTAAFASLLLETFILLNHPDWDLFLGISPASLLAILIVSSALPALLLFPKAKERSGLIICLSLALLLVPASLNWLEWNRASLKKPEILELSSLQDPSRRVVSIGFSPGFILPPNWGQAFGTRQGEINSALFPNDFFRLFHVGDYPATFVIFGKPEMVMFQQLGASGVLISSGRDLSPLKKLCSGPGADLYGIPDARGRCFFADKISPRAPGTDLSRQIMDLGGGKDGCVVIEGREGTRPVDIGSPPGTWEIKVAEDEPSSFRCFAKSEGGGLFVLRDTYHRGWEAAVDGKASKILRVNGCFRGLFLEKGEHEIEMKYKPSLTRTSLWISALSLLSALSWICLSRRREAPFEDPGRPEPEPGT